MWVWTTAFSLLIFMFSLREVCFIKSKWDVPLVYYSDVVGLIIIDLMIETLFDNSTWNHHWLVLP